MDIFASHLFVADVSGGSGQDLFHHLAIDIRQSIIPTKVAGGELEVIDAEEV